MIVKKTGVGAKRALAASAKSPKAAADPLQDIRERLSPVVLEIYSREDFHRVDMRSIARAAGMSFTTIYQYFGDKESLLFSFISYWLEDLYPLALQPLTDEKNVKDKLNGYLRAHLEFYDAHPQVGRIIFLTVPLDRWMKDPTYKHVGPTKALLNVISEGQRSGELRTDVPPELILDALAGIFNRAVLMREYRKRKYTLKSQADPLFSILWSGIAGNGEPPSSNTDNA